MTRDLSPEMKYALVSELKANPTFTVLQNRRRDTRKALDRRGLVDKGRLTIEGENVARQLLEPIAHLDAREQLIALGVRVRPLPIR